MTLQKGCVEDDIQDVAEKKTSWIDNWIPKEKEVVYLLSNPFFFIDASGSSMGRVVGPVSK